MCGDLVGGLLTVVHGAADGGRSFQRSRFVDGKLGDARSDAPIARVVGVFDPSSASGFKNANPDGIAYFDDGRVDDGDDVAGVLPPAMPGAVPCDEVARPCIGKGVDSLPSRGATAVR